MKQLNTYLEGLLSKTDKTSTSSASDDMLNGKLSELNNLYSTKIVSPPRVYKTDKTVLFEVRSGKLFVTCEHKQHMYLNGEVLAELTKYITKELDFREIIFDIDEVEIICEYTYHFANEINLRFDRVNIENISSNDMPAYMQRINLTCNKLYIGDKIVLNEFNIDAPNIFVKSNETPINRYNHSRLKNKNLIFLTADYYAMGNRLKRVNLIDMDSRGYIKYKSLTQSDRDRLETINLFRILGLSDYFKSEISRIIITGDDWVRGEALVFTKKLKKYPSLEVDGRELTSEESVIEMADGWYAIWTKFGKALLK